MSSGDHKELREVFDQAGWEEMKSDTVEQFKLFDGVFLGSYAVCAVSRSESSREAIERWSNLQGALAELKGQKDLFGQRDIYLLFIVDRVDESRLGELQNILDDTRVCRKICLEKDERSIQDTLSDDVPFFLTPGTQHQSSEEPAESVEEHDGLPSTIQSDLERVGPQRILDRLLSGDYEAS